MHSVYVICIIAVILFLLAVIAVYTTAPTSELAEYHGYSRFKVKRGVAMITDHDTVETAEVYSRHNGLNIVYANSVDVKTIESLYSLGYRIIIINAECDVHLQLSSQISSDIILIIARGLVKGNCLSLDMYCIDCPEASTTPLTSTIQDFNALLWDALLLSSSIIKYASSRLTPGSVVRLATDSLVGVTGPIYFTTDGRRVVA